MNVRTGQRDARTSEQSGGNGGQSLHEHRTAKVVELIGVSQTSFEDAIQCTLEDAGKTIRGITGAHVENMSVRCENGKITEYKVNLKVAFGIERAERP